MKRIITILILVFCIQIVLANNAKIAAIQLTAKQQSFEELKQSITNYATKAKKQGANIIVFPEDDMLNLIYNEPWSKDSLVKLSKFYVQIKDFVSDLSRKLDVYIVAGSTVKQKDQKLYNTALVGLPSGYVIEQDKIYLTPSERKVGYTGSGNDILVLNTKFGRVAILICYTSEFANISLALSQIEPDIIIVPSYTDDIYGLNRIQTAIKMLSIQNYSYGVAVGMVSNLDKNNLENADGVAQILFTSPQQKEFPTGEIAKGKFNYEQMLIEDFDISKLHLARENYTAYPNKDAKDMQKNLSIKSFNFR
ncbi:putative amidohydrolase [Allofrancisella inopinata]|uniref:nitrilase-related carbon-nitrogen hydrolase n=1 Tax=Allofrancisella inopinata TaxID=1085647 RepID=UPI0010DD5316|nr:nitrilase-related carbon-nitrogen hydrolase [Allofrancisella inopinata]TDT73340.1 putative amidohydrolase [Allofrancisella inopinata]